MALSMVITEEGSAMKRRETHEVPLLLRVRVRVRVGTLGRHLGLISLHLGLIALFVIELPVCSLPSQWLGANPQP